MEHGMVMACPYCHASEIPAQGNGNTCGAFACLYRRYCGAPPSLPAPRLGPFPWDRPETVRRIAVFRPGLVGDLILAGPGLRALRRGFPAAEITLISLPWAVDLVPRFPWIDRVLPFRELPPGWTGPEPDGDDEAFLREARSHGYDLVLQLQADGPAAARFVLAFRGRVTAGFCRDEEVGRPFHLLLPMLEDEPELFRVLRLVCALGARPDGIQLEYPLLPGDLAEVDACPELRGLLGHRPLVVLHPGARPPSRRWPPERFAAVVDLLHRRRGAGLVLVGGAEEASLLEQVLKRCASPVVNLAGRLSLGGLGALLRRADLFVGNDSGPAQLAAAVSPSSVRIFGPANRGRWAPLDRAHHRVVYQQVECSPCGHFECPLDHRCLRRVGVDEVMAEVDSLLAEAAASVQDVEASVGGAAESRKAA